MQRVVDEPEPVARPEIAERVNIGSDRGAVELVLQEHDQMQMVSAAPLPLCNTSNRPDGEPASTETTFRSAVEFRPAMGSGAVPAMDRVSVPERVRARSGDRDQSDRMGAAFQRGQENPPIVPET